MSDQVGFWKNYYKDVAEKNSPWLDFSNHRVQLQTQAFCLEAVGRIEGLTCIDVGCGQGQLVRSYNALGASRAIGMDFQPALVETGRRKDPSVEWLLGDVSRPTGALRDLQADIISLVEVLQYVDAGEAIENWWNQVRSGGRVVFVIPNAHCPIVSGTQDRFSGYYKALGVEDVATIIGRICDVRWWRYRELRFAQDQCVAPYEASPWYDAAKPLSGNRLQFVIEKN